MSIYQDLPEVQVREKRLNSILAYHGDSRDLLNKSKNNELETKTRCYMQCGSCAMSTSMTAISHIQDIAVIGHSPIGCNCNVAQQNVIARLVGQTRGIEGHQTRYICSNIEEKDTIYGASEKLTNAIEEADRRFKPKAIFIQTSCASGIIGEDVESIASDEEKKLGYPVIPIYCEGFKSTIWASGFDAGYHGVVRRLVKQPKKKQDDLINIFDFFGGDRLKPILEKINLRANYVAGAATVEQIETMSEAAATVHVCETLSTYPASVLEEVYGVPQINAPAPFGVEWTDEFLRAIAKQTNREEITEKVINEAHENIKPKLEEYRAKFNGKKAFVICGNALAHNLLSISHDLGFELSGVNTLHHDGVNDNKNFAISLERITNTAGNIENYSVCNVQPYQLIKLVKKVNPDIILVRHDGADYVGTHLGIPTLFVGDFNGAIGYDGLLDLAAKIEDTLNKKKLFANIGKHSVLPYSKWWLEEEDAFYFEGGKNK